MNEHKCPRCSNIIARECTACNHNHAHKRRPIVPTMKHVCLLKQHLTLKVKLNVIALNNASITQFMHSFFFSLSLSRSIWGSWSVEYAVMCKIAALRYILLSAVAFQCHIDDEHAFFSLSFAYSRDVPWIARLRELILAFCRGCMREERLNNLLVGLKCSASVLCHSRWDDGLDFYRINGGSPLKCRYLRFEPRSCTFSTTSTFGIVGPWPRACSRSTSRCEQSCSRYSGMLHFHLKQ
jgi:hypothetical protein